VAESNNAQLPLAVLGPGADFREVILPFKRPRGSADGHQGDEFCRWVGKWVRRLVSSGLLAWSEEERAQLATNWPDRRENILAFGQLGVPVRQEGCTEDRLCAATCHQAAEADGASVAHGLRQSRCLRKFESAIEAAQPERSVATGRARKPEVNQLPIVMLGPEGIEPLLESYHARWPALPADTETTAHPYADPGLPAQVWLFPDDARTRGYARRHQSHRVRARVRPRKERSTAAFQAQGTFFGAHLAGAVPG
jgi:hypothetical protein